MSLLRSFHTPYSSLSHSLKLWNILTLSQFLLFSLLIYKYFLIIYTPMRRHILFYFFHILILIGTSFSCVLNIVLWRIFSLSETLGLYLMNGLHFLVLLFVLSSSFMIDPVSQGLCYVLRIGWLRRTEYRTDKQETYFFSKYPTANLQGWRSRLRELPYSEVTRQVRLVEGIWGAHRSSCA